MNWDNRKVLVTGADGFIGSHLAHFWGFSSVFIAMAVTAFAGFLVMLFAFVFLKKHFLVGNNAAL